jgi:hypothetical protein
MEAMVEVTFSRNQSYVGVALLLEKLISLEVWSGACLLVIVSSRAPTITPSLVAANTYHHTVAGGCQPQPGADSSISFVDR